MSSGGKGGGGAAERKASYRWPESALSSSVYLSEGRVKGYYWEEARMKG